jgi:hypothetical protein
MGRGAYGEGVSLHMKTTVFWNVMPCSLVDIMTFQKKKCCSHYEGSNLLMINTAGSFEASVGR